MSAEAKQNPSAAGSFLRQSTGCIGGCAWRGGIVTTARRNAELTRFPAKAVGRIVVVGIAHAVAYGRPSLGVGIACCGGVANSAICSR